MFQKIQLLKVSNPRKLMNIFFSFGAVYFVTFSLILPLLLYDIKYSAYYFPTKDYNKDIKTEIKYNNHEVTKAKSWIRHMALNGQNKLHSSNLVMSPNKLQVLITIISMRRNKIDGYDPQYVTRTVAKLFEIMREFEKSTGVNDFFGLLLCNVDATPAGYSELNQISKNLNIPIIVRFNNSSPTLEESKNPYHKERTDYTYCLHKSVELSPQYILMLEDDAVPKDNALHVLHRIITYQLKYHMKETDSIGFIKFYHPYRFLSRVWWFELIGLSCFFGTILFFIYCCVRRQSITNGHLLFMYFEWSLCILYVFLIGLTLGQANLLKFRLILAGKYYYTLSPSPNCCTPAMFFSKANGQLFAQYYDEHPCQTKECPMDVILANFEKDTKTRGLMTLPNIFDHIGMYSVVKMNVKFREIVN